MAKRADRVELHGPGDTAGDVRILRCGCVEWKNICARAFPFPADRNAPKADVMPSGASYAPRTLCWDLTGQVMCAAEHLKLCSPK